MVPMVPTLTNKRLQMLVPPLGDEIIKDWIIWKCLFEKGDSFFFYEECAQMCDKLNGNRVDRMQSPVAQQSYNW